MQFQLALITGASSGIGTALCRLFANEGINLIIAGRSLERLQAVKSELETKVSIEIVVGELSNQEDRAKLIEVIHERVPTLVINNAGYGLYGDALSYETDKQLSILEVNGMAVLELTLEAARTLISYGKQGVILNVSSAAAFQIYPGLAVYSAAKAFVNHVSESLDLEMSPYGVRVLAACPGMVDTQFAERAGKVNQATDEGLVMTTVEVAELIWEQIQDPVPVKVINWKYRLLTALSKFIPRSLLTKKLKNEVISRIESREIKRIKVKQ